MLIYIIKKLLSFFLVLFLLSLVSVIIVYYSPDSALRSSQTFIQAYCTFYQQIFLQEFVVTDYSLWQILSQIILPTFELCILAIIGSIIIGFPIGIFAGLTNNGKIDHIIRLICLILYASPLIWLTILVMAVYHVDWNFVKNAVYQPATTSVSILGIFLTHNIDKVDMLLNEIKHLLLPVMILVIQPCIITIQLISQQVSTTAQQNFIKVANIREKSLLKVMFRHLLPNSIPSAIPQLTYNITTLLFSTMIIEILLNRSGLGTWVFSAFHKPDYTVMALAIFCCGALVSLLTLLSEIIVVILYPIQSRSLYE